jgi:hypothetical protein
MRAIVGSAGGVREALAVGVKEVPVWSEFGRESVGDEGEDRERWRRIV